MAEARLQINDEGAAKTWVAKAKDLVKEAESLMTMVGKILQSVDADSEGDFVQHLVNAANNMLNFANAVADGMRYICDTLNQVLDEARSMIGDAIQVITRLIGS